MQLPFFYIGEIDIMNDELVLDESNSRHAVSVLRMQEGAALYVTDGKGHLINAVIIDNHKKKCRLRVTGSSSTAEGARRTAIAISLIKNPVRFEWFLEKATEIGVTDIFPLHCQRTEKQHYRQDRMHNVLVSALLQSRQTWLPLLHEPMKYMEIVKQDKFGQKFIAHCLEENKKQLDQSMIDATASRLILIGPEGDFTLSEIEQALQCGFVPITLGETRLRTETAGIVASVLLKNFN